jgi:hypothetical protein
MTGAIQAFCPEHAELLPGLWSVLFSLGIIASYRHLPAGTVGLAGYYLAAGLVCVICGRDDQALRPWTMALTFGVGQWLAAVILYREGGRSDEFA